MEILYQPVKAGSSLQSCRNESIIGTRILKQNQNLNLLTNFNNNEHIGSTKASTTNSPENAKSFHHTYIESLLCCVHPIILSSKVQHRTPKEKSVHEQTLVSGINNISGRKRATYKIQETKKRIMVETGYQKIDVDKNTKHKLARPPVRYYQQRNETREFNTS